MAVQKNYVQLSFYARDRDMVPLLQGLPTNISRYVGAVWVGPGVYTSEQVVDIPAILLDSLLV